MSNMRVRALLDEQRGTSDMGRKLPRHEVSRGCSYDFEILYP